MDTLLHKAGLFFGWLKLRLTHLRWASNNAVAKLLSVRSKNVRTAGRQCARCQLSSVSREPVRVLGLHVVQRSSHMCKLFNTLWHRCGLDDKRKLFVGKKNVNNLTISRKNFGFGNLDKDLRTLRIPILRCRVIDTTKVLVRLQPALLVNVPTVLRIFKLGSNVSSQPRHLFTGALYRKNCIVSRL